MVIIQGSNDPIVIDVTEISEPVKAISAILIQYGKYLKTWTLDNVNIDGNLLTLPLTEYDTLSLGNGVIELDIKILTDEDRVLFADIIRGSVIKRENRTEMTDIAFTETGDNTVRLTVKDGTVVRMAYSPYIGDNGHWYTYNDDTKTYVDTGVTAEGTPGLPGSPGDPGAPGKDAVSPVITVTDIENGHTITITDVYGKRSFDIVNGTPGTPGAPGNDGKTPIVGEDYFTEADKASMIQEVETGVQPSVSAINQALAQLEQDVEDKADKTELANKVGYSEVVNGQLLMYSDNTKTKLLTTMDLPTGGSTDVQINGTSITEDGVANIPAAKDDKYGVVKIGTTWYGLQNMASGRLAIIPALDSDIKNRASDTYYRPLTANQINSSVKAALTDSNKIALSDSEKAVACETLGAVPYMPTLEVNSVIEFSGTNGTASNEYVRTEGNIVRMEILIDRSACQSDRSGDAYYSFGDKNFSLASDDYTFSTIYLGYSRKYVAIIVSRPFGIGMPSISYGYATETYGMENQVMMSINRFAKWMTGADSRALNGVKIPMKYTGEKAYIKIWTI